MADSVQLGFWPEISVAVRSAKDDSLGGYSQPVPHLAGGASDRSNSWKSGRDRNDSSGWSFLKRVGFA